jgi:hypothetical protein
MCMQCALLTLVATSSECGGENGTIVMDVYTGHQQAGGCSDELPWLGVFTQPPRSQCAISCC